jgi:pSer/pThr/pTyr-binding forkhead associated (FHA) protein
MAYDMDQNRDRIAKKEKSGSKFSQDKDFGSSTTSELPRDGIIERIPIATRSYLVVKGFEEQERIIELEGGELVIGRSPECGICLPVDTVSRNHARIFLQNEEYTIEDLGSANGTYVNGIKVVRCVLRNNDQLTIGEVKMVFYEDRALDQGGMPY